MFGMVAFTQPGSGEDDDREAHVSPVGLEVTANSPSGSVLTTAGGRTLYATESTAEIRCLVEKAMEERAPILHVVGAMGDKGANPRAEVSDFYLPIGSILSIHGRDAAACVQTRAFIVTTTRRSAQELGDLWRSKMALLER